MQINFKNVLLIGLAAFMAVSCSKKKTTESGFTFEYVDQNVGRKASVTDVVTFHFSLTDAKDSVLAASDVNQPFSPHFIVQDSAKTPDMVFMNEIMQEVAAGDSIVATTTAENIFGRRIPPHIVAGQELNLCVRVLEVYTKDEFDVFRQKKFEEMRAEEAKKMEEMKAKQEEHKAIDDELIAKYIKDNNLTGFTKTESGLYYAITKQGNGSTPPAGANVTAHYRGTLLDGTEFDASYNRNQPFTFPIGQGRVISGWDEGFKYLKKGGKGTLIIPSHLAYGGRQAGAIPPFSVLLFEVELLDFATNPNAK